MLKFEHLPTAVLDKFTHSPAGDVSEWNRISVFMKGTGLRLTYVGSDREYHYLQQFGVTSGFARLAITKE